MRIFDSNKTNSSSFNITPVIDIVFLLIIFFMLVCQFITAENFSVAVPDEVSEAQSRKEENPHLTTVTIINDKQTGIVFAVGSEKISTGDSEPDSEILTAMIDAGLSTLQRPHRVVCLRCDRDITFRHVKHALSAINQSSATDIQLAVIKQNQY